MGHTLRPFCQRIIPPLPGPVPGRYSPPRNRGFAMTYCCGVLVRDGLVLIADTRTNAGLDNVSTFRKLHIFE